MTELSQEAQWLVAAAKGDCEAQAALAHFCLANVATGVTTFEALAMAEPFARLAAESGEPFDRLLLADVLAARSIELRRMGFEARADCHRESAFALYDEAAQSADPEVIASLTARLTDLADLDEAAADRLNRLMDRLTPEAAGAARSGAKRRLRDTEKYWSELAAITAEEPRG